MDEMKGVACATCGKPVSTFNVPPKGMAPVCYDCNMERDPFSLEYVKRTKDEFVKYYRFLQKTEPSNRVPAEWAIQALDDFIQLLEEGEPYVFQGGEVP